MSRIFLIRRTKRCDFFVYADDEDAALALASADVPDRDSVYSDEPEDEVELEVKDEPQAARIGCTKEQPYGTDMTIGTLLAMAKEQREAEVARRLIFNQTADLFPGGGR